MAKRDVTVWMDEHVYCALSECLPEGTSIEQELARMLESGPMSILWTQKVESSC